MKNFLALAAPLSLVLLGACASSSAPGPYVVATLQPTRDSSTAGTVWFVQSGTDLQVMGRVSGLKPNQEHGFHVHEKGDCSSPDAMSAGGHFNPTGKPHGPPTGERHAGDLPALKADAAGRAVFRFRIPGNVLGSGPADFGAKAVIVHAMPDDYTTQPTGNSGGRIACGVIASAPGQDASGRAVPLPPDF
ncbi:MAG TPA: superoxide dismutase family protein [Caldimonas sp.]|jgi:Cu-Zn family superoxide dismutase|nr:superoxide dismutase family protein [Caldimonas sp.]HEX2541912.1 superoxide dismutase family protein [Caldimonas sp.]